MAYEEYSRETFSSECACGKGVVQYSRRYMYNDWGHDHVYNTPFEIVCANCSQGYHCEEEGFSVYLVPNGSDIPRNPPTYCSSFILDIEEMTVSRCSQEELKTAFADMTAPKRRYIKNLTNRDAEWFAEQMWQLTGKKSLAPISSRLRDIIERYDNIYVQVQQKQKIKEKYIQEQVEFDKRHRDVMLRSKKLLFSLAEIQHSSKHEAALLFWERYKEEHSEEVADLEMDLTFEIDFSGLSWDSYNVVKCIDSQFVLKVDSWLPSKNKLTKKYLCKCVLCGQEVEHTAVDFCIKQKFGMEYYPVSCCSCHKVSSFEAKTMDILNYQGISYIREMTFANLVGDTGKPLRFDFALFKKYSDKTSAIIDLIIELQGPHHYETGYYDEDGDYITEELSANEQWTAQRRLERQTRYDQMKREYCAKNGIRIEYIKYTSTDYSSLENRIRKILEESGYEWVPEQDKLNTWVW